MKKTEINKVLKEAGYGNIKVQDGSWSDGKCYTNYEGKRVKGIKGGSVGPTTVTSAYQEKNDEIINSVTKNLIEAGMKEEGNNLVSENGKIKLSLMVTYFPTYTRSAGYDDAYETAYIQPVFH